MHNLIEYSSNYSKTTESLCFYSEDESASLNNNFQNTDSFKSLEYKSKLLGNAIAQLVPNESNGIQKNETLAVPLNYLSNFWRSLEMPLINCKIASKPKWTKYCVLYVARNNNNTNANPKNIIFTIKHTRHKIMCISRHFISNR